MKVTRRVLHRAGFWADLRGRVFWVPKRNRIPSSSCWRPSPEAICSTPASASLHLIAVASHPYVPRSPRPVAREAARTRCRRLFGSGQNHKFAQLRTGSRVRSARVSVLVGIATLWSVLAQAQTPSNPPWTATLTDLTLTDTTLSPDFEPSNLTYAASVANQVSTITVTATASDENSSFEIVSKDGTPIEDVDADTDGQQIGLTEGPNQIGIVVSAGDGAATQTYTLNLSRNRIPSFDDVPETGAVRSVRERKSAATPVGKPIVASDADEGDVLTYSVDGADSAYFDVDAQTGQLLTKVVFNYEKPVDADGDNAYQLVVKASDGLDEAIVAVTVRVLNVSEWLLPAGGVLVGAAAALEATKDDDGPEPTSLAVTLSPTQVGESDGSTTINVTGTLIGGVFSRDMNFTVTAHPGTATETVDYAIGRATLTIGGRQTTGTTQLSFTPTADDFDEDDEMVTVTVNNAELQLAVTPASVTITDDDTRGVAVSDTTLAFDEGGTGTYSVVLNSAPTSDPVSIDVSVTGDSDVTVSPQTLTFTASDWDVPQTVTAHAGHDPDAAGDSATIEHRVGGADYGANNVAADAVSVSVTDDELVSTTVTLSLSPNSVAESAGQTVFTVRGELNGGAFLHDTSIAVFVSSGSATEGEDYTAGTTTLVIAANQTTGTADLTVEPLPDYIDEGDETVLADAVVAGLSVNPATLTIADDDRRGLTVSHATLAIDEGSSSDVSVALTSEPTGPVSVALTAEGNSDVSVSPDTLTFTAQNWSLPQVVTVDAVHDDDAVNDGALVRYGVSGGDYGFPRRHRGSLECFG